MFSFYAENEIEAVPATIVRRGPHALYCIGFHSCSSTCRLGTVAAEMFCSLGINCPPSQWRLDLHDLGDWHTNLSQQNSNRKARGEKPKVTIFHKCTNWISVHGLHSSLLSHLCRGLILSKRWLSNLKYIT